MNGGQGQAYAVMSDARKWKTFLKRAVIWKPITIIKIDK